MAFIKHHHLFAIYGAVKIVVKFDERVMHDEYSVTRRLCRRINQDQKVNKHAWQNCGISSFPFI